MRKGYLLFHGGDAFTPKSKQADHDWLKLVRKGQTKPRLVVVPAAEMRNPQKAAQDVAAYYGNLGAFAEYAEIADAQTANSEADTLALDKADAIVLTDGSPMDLVERLRGTRTEAALQRALQRKAAVLGAGASATVLGAVYWFANEWEPGLGLASHLAVLPHHNLLRMRLAPGRLLAGLPPGVTLLGVDQDTVLIWLPDDSYRVVGEGLVTVYRSPKELVEYAPGRTFTLDEESG